MAVPSPPTGLDDVRARAGSVSQRLCAKPRAARAFSLLVAADNVVATTSPYRADNVVSTTVSDVASVVEESLSRSIIVGRNIVLGRLLLGWTQAHLAEQVEKRPNYVSDWERGLHLPRDEHLKLLAEKLEQDEPWFYTRHDAEWDEHGVE